MCYTQVRSNDSPKARAAKTKCSSLARQKINFRYAWQKLWLLLAANFHRGDLWVTVGYDDEHLPPNRKEAKKEIAAFWKRMRAARNSRGAPAMKYVYCTHEIQDDGSRRLHHHFVVSGTGAGDYDELRAMWTGGSNVEIRVIGDRDKYPCDDFMELAKYMLHERNPELAGHATGDRGYSGSRNLVKPEVESHMVDDSTTVGVPPEAYVIERDSNVNEHGSFDYIFYLLPERPPAKLKKAPIFSVSG